MDAPLEVDTLLPPYGAEQEWKQIKHQLSIADQPPWPGVPDFCPPTGRSRGRRRSVAPEGK